MTEMKDIHEFAARVAAEFHPRQIILFGSYARDAAISHSDVDLLVVLPFQGKSWQMAAEIRRRIRAPFPMDLLARTPGQIQRRLEMNDAFIRAVTQEGIVLYAA